MLLIPLLLVDRLCSPVHLGGRLPLLHRPVNDVVDLVRFRRSLQLVQRPPVQARVLGPEPTREGEEPPPDIAVLRAAGVEGGDDGGLHLHGQVLQKGHSVLVQAHALSEVRDGNASRPRRHAALPRACGRQRRVVARPVRLQRGSWHVAATAAAHGHGEARRRHGIQGARAAARGQRLAETHEAAGDIAVLGAGGVERQDDLDLQLIRQAPHHGRGLLRQHQPPRPEAPHVPEQAAPDVAVLGAGGIEVLEDALLHLRSQSCQEARRILTQAQ
mmetsp:Transcript_168756/g.542367  ORF Transcript_168756/g.542367 Transcript_168756/m.542367 type:complete len:273 (+) Transcript_168756:832-1650(+)